MKLRNIFKKDLAHNQYNPVAVLYWKGAYEFPTESKVLYDRAISDHLAPDIIYALAVGICERLGKSPG